MTLSAVGDDARTGTRMILCKRACMRQSQPGRAGSAGMRSAEPPCARPLIGHQRPETRITRLKHPS
jgi:hypothetical protein